MGYYQGLRSRSAVAESTLSKQYFFLIFFTLIFYSVIGTTLISLLITVTSDPQEIPKLLANVLPTVSKIMRLLQVDLGSLTFNLSFFFLACSFLYKLYNFARFFNVSS